MTVRSGGAGSDLASGQDREGRAEGLAWLGASNFARCLPELGNRLAAERPGTFCTSVCGHGRSYCGPSLLGSRWLGRELPSIPATWAGSGAFGPIQAGQADFDMIIGDFGNDLAYGRSAAEVLDRAEAILGQPWRHIVLVAPPLESVAALPRWAFRVASVLLFPGRSLKRDELLTELVSLHAGLRSLSSEIGASWVEIPVEWMSWDGIHVRRRFRRRFVARVTAPLLEGEGEPLRAGDPGTGGPAHPGEWPSWWRRRPEREAVWWLGRRTEIRHRAAETSAGGDQRGGGARFL